MGQDFSLLTTYNAEPTLTTHFVFFSGLNFFEQEVLVTKEEMVQKICVLFRCLEAFAFTWHSLKKYSPGKNIAAIAGR